MTLGWKRVLVVFENHETLSGFLEKEDDTGIQVLVMAPEGNKGVPGIWFFPWHGVVSVFNVDSKTELKKRQKTLDAAKAAKTPAAKKEAWREAWDWTEEDDGHRDDTFC